MSCKSEISYCVDYNTQVESDFLQRFLKNIIKDEFSIYFTECKFELDYKIDPDSQSTEEIIQQKINYMSSHDPDNDIFFTLIQLGFDEFHKNLEQLLEKSYPYDKPELFLNENNIDSEKKRKMFIQLQTSSFDEKNKEPQTQNTILLYKNQKAQESNVFNQGEIVLIKPKIKKNQSWTKKYIQSLKSIIEQQIQNILNFRIISTNAQA